MKLEVEELEVENYIGVILKRAFYPKRIKPTNMINLCRYMFSFFFFGWQKIHKQRKLYLFQRIKY